MALLVIVAAAGVLGASWWARELGRLFNGHWLYDFTAGAVVALTPLILGALGFRRKQRKLMGFGLALYAWSLATQPYMSWAFADHELAHIYAHQVPGYLPGLGLGLALGVAAVAPMKIRER